MNSKRLYMSKTASISSLRLVARALSFLSIGIVLLLAFGEGVPFSAFSGSESLLFLCFPLGVCLGTILAWRWEVIGGGIALASLIAFYLLHFAVSKRFPKGVAFLTLTVPGLLFLVCGVSEQRGLV
jgi:hypothetical protein